MRRGLIAVLFASAMVLPLVTLAQVGDHPTGTPPGVAPLKSQNSRGFPPPALTPGQPVETRAPEKLDDKPVFAGQTRAPFQPSVKFQTVTLTDQLNKPWSMAFLPDGGILITQKAGTMRILNRDRKLSRPVSGVPMVLSQGQVGLLDVVLDPKFASNHRLFFSYAEPVGSDKFNIALARAMLGNNALHDVKVIFRAKPALPNALTSNSGGRIAIGHDGNIFMTVGDRSKSPPWQVAQQLDNHLGKMIRITPEGAPAPGNPFLGKKGALPEIYSYGHRSEEGLAVDARGRLWETENGPRGGDELNLIEPGKNYGWPVILHGIDYPGEAIGEGKTEQAGMEQARYYWDPVIAPSGLAFYDANLFPQWKGSVFVGALRGMLLDRLTLAGDKVAGEEPLLIDQHSRIRDVRVGPEGAVYVLSDEGKLFRLTPL
jgi:glucose/arabinose dehydrogenase